MLERRSPALVDTRIVALSAERWAVEPDRCRNVVDEALSNTSTRFLLLDTAGLTRLRTVKESSLNDEQTIIHIHLGGWLRMTAQHYSADEEQIAQDLLRSAGAKLWINCAAHTVDALKDVLQHMRRVLFGAVRWPDTIVFILREDAVQGAMDLLPGTFYLLPSTKSQRESSLYAFNIYRSARRAYMFGLSRSSIRRGFSGEGLAHRWRKLIRDDEIDYIK